MGSLALLWRSDCPGEAVVKIQGNCAGTKLWLLCGVVPWLKRWQEYTEELYKKDLHDLDNHDGVITYLEPDILECEVKWALESITKNKASGGGW